MEILSFVFGGIFRIVPEIMKLVDRQKDRDHEVKMFDLQIQADKLRGEIAMASMTARAELQQQLVEVQAMVEANKAQAVSHKKTGIWLVDVALGFAEALSALVRPVLTYWYCVFAYGTYKAAVLSLVLSTGATWQNAVTQLWTPMDEAVMLSIIGFWFVDRALRKLKV